MKQSPRRAAGFVCLCVSLTLSAFSQTQQSQKTIVVPISSAPQRLEHPLTPQKDAATVDQIHEYLKLSGNIEPFRSRWIAAVDRNRDRGQPYWPESFWTAIKTEMQQTDLVPEYVAILQHGISRNLMQEVLDAYQRLGADHFVGSPECFKLGLALDAENDDMEKLGLAKTVEVITKVFYAHKPELDAAKVKYQAEHPDWTVSLPTLVASASGQRLSPTDAKLARTARAHYYNLQQNGFESMTCSVAFDLATVPLIPPSADDPIRQLVEHSEFTLALDEKGRPDVRHRFPSNVTEAQTQTAAQIVGLMKSLISGLFLTWSSKGLTGPIPPFDSEITSVTTSDDGYSFLLNGPGAPATVALNKDFSVKEIVSAHKKLHEYPTYKPTAEGLVFASNKAIDESSLNGPVKIQYELDSAFLEGLYVPSAAHLRVNDNIDTKFSLRDCTVKKGIVIQMKPPA